MACLFLCGAAAALAACGTGDESRWPHLTMLVAQEARAYVQDVPAKLLDYKERMGVVVKMEMVPAAGLLARLEQAPVPDLVVVADPALVRVLAERKLIDPRQWLVERERDRVVIVARPDAAFKVDRLEDLARPEFKAIGSTTYASSSLGTVVDSKIRELPESGGLLRKIELYPDQTRLVDAIAAGKIPVGFVQESLLPRFTGKVKALHRFDPAAGVYPPYVALAALRGSAHPAAAHQAWGQFEAFFRNPEMFMRDARPGAGKMIGLDDLAS